MIEAQGLTRRYGEFTAVSGVSFSVPDGEILGMLGPNGADGGLGVGAAHALEPGAVAQVLADPHLAVERHRLRQVADLPPRQDRLGDEVVAVHRHPAGRRRQEAGDHADGGGLAGAVGAQHA